MPRPWEGNDYDQTKPHKIWGPEKVSDQEGKEVVSRDDFYDKMVANGWNKEGDDKLLAAMYNLGAHAVELGGFDSTFFANIMKVNVTDRAQREAVLAMTANLPFDLKHYSFQNEGFVAMDQAEDIRKQRNEESLYNRLRRQGYDIYENLDDIVFVMTRLNNAAERKETVSTRDTIEKGDYSSASYDLERIIRISKEKGLFDEHPDMGERFEKEFQRLEGLKQSMNLSREAEANLRRTTDLREYMSNMIKSGLYDAMAQKNPDGSNFDISQLGDEWAFEGPVIIEEDDDPEDIIDNAIEEESEYIQTNRTNIRNAYNNLIAPIVKCIQDNPEFLEAVKEGKSTAGIGVKHFNEALLRINGIEGKLTEQKKAQDLGILDKLGNQVKTKDIKEPKDMFSEKNANDLFWEKYSPAITKDDIAEIKAIADRLELNGLRFDEFFGTNRFNEIMKATKLPQKKEAAGAGKEVKIEEEAALPGTGEVDNPVPMIQMALSDRAADALDRYNKYDLETALKAMNKIERFYQRAKENQEEAHFMDLGARALGFWFRENGYDMLNNSLKVTNGFDKIEIPNGNQVMVENVITFNTEVDKTKFNRDLLSHDEYKQMVEYANEASKIYNDHSKSFTKLYNTGESLEHGNLRGDVAANVVKEMERDKDGMEAINRFRHLMYKIKEADANVCKLVDIKNKKNVKVEAINEDTKFTKGMVDREVSYLDMCAEMLREPAERVHWNSREYKNIQSSLSDLKKALQQNYPTDEKARNAYIKATDNVLKNISLYREHKAKTGIKDQSGMRDKLIAVERVDKLMRSRYKNLAKRDYQDTISGMYELFDVKVDDELMGDEYVYATAESKIANMKKSVKDLQKEFDSALAEDNGRKSLGGKQDTHDLFGSILETYREEIIRDNAKTAQEKEVEEAFKRNFLLEDALKKEEDYRVGKDTKDEFWQERLVVSSSTTLFLLAIEDKCKAIGIASGVQEGSRELNSQMASYDKQGILAVDRFMNKFLTDKDFNKEFKDRMLKGVEKNKVSTEDIRRYRDEALEACYTKYKGKDLKALDELSDLLGSDKNSQTVKNKVGLKGLLDEEAKANPSQERTSIKRSNTITEDKTKKSKTTTAHTKV